MNPLIIATIAAQACVVLFIALHDWIPLGKLNNLSGIRAADSAGRSFLVTVLSMLPFAIGLAASTYYASSGFPMWLMWFLWVTYGFNRDGVRGPRCRGERLGS